MMVVAEAVPVERMRVGVEPGRMNGGTADAARAFGRRALVLAASVASMPRETTTAFFMPGRSQLCAGGVGGVKRRNPRHRFSLRGEPDPGIGKKQSR